MAYTDLMELIRLRFLAILESIHDAGILHGNLRLDNLLVNDSGDVAIVDFDEAKQRPDVNLVHKERQFLDGLLKVAVDSAE
jgi:serine/threonine protein kinase